MMPQSARILTTACPKPAVPLEDCQREYGRVMRSASPHRSRSTEPSSFPPSCTVLRPGFSFKSRSGYWSGFTNAACAPSLASNGKTACRTKKSSRDPACPAQSPSCFRCSCAGPVPSQDRKTCSCPWAQRRRTQLWYSRKRYKDQLKRQLAQAGISHPAVMQQEACDRDRRRSSERRATRKFEV